MKCAATAAMSSSNDAIGLIVQRQAKSAISAAVTAATIKAKPAMKSAPRGEAISGRADSARQSGQLAKAAIHSAVNTARVSGFQAERGSVAFASGRGMGLFCPAIGAPQVRRLKPPADRPPARAPIKWPPLPQ